MIELKPTTVYDAYWKANSVGEGTGVLVYLKSEADKVIEYLEESHKKEVEQLLMEIVELKSGNRKLRDDVHYLREENLTLKEDLRELEER